MPSKAICAGAPARGNTACATNGGELRRAQMGLSGGGGTEDGGDELIGELSFVE
jgi:hypothetical protein